MLPQRDRGIWKNGGQTELVTIGHVCLQAIAGASVLEVVLCHQCHVIQIQIRLFDIP